MRQHIKIPLPEEDYARLSELAEQQVRPLPMQAEYMLRAALRLSSEETAVLAGCYEIILRAAKRVHAIEAACEGQENAAGDQPAADDAEVKRVGADPASR